jgi:membrane-bound lytic murein transglycosylase B
MKIDQDARLSYALQRAPALRTVRATALRAARSISMLALCMFGPVISVQANAHGNVLPPVSYADRPEVRVFIEEMVADHGFNARALRRVFSKVRYQPSIINAMSRPIVAPAQWFEYAPRFLNPARIDAGVAFWRRNAATLKRAQGEFGVPPEVVVAIIGVETFYGRNTGSYRVADALATLAFDYPRRSEYFRGELKQFLLESREQHISPLVPKGSYAGAQGLPQFMPSSLRDYAVDFDGDGSIDLANDVDDAIGSVANYLARQGWRPDEPAMKRAESDAGIVDLRMRTQDGGISEQRTLESWQGDGVRVSSAAMATGSDPTGILMLEGESDPEFWLVFNNWYVLTRYNRSRLYASAVWQLAEAIRQARTDE